MKTLLFETFDDNTLYYREDTHDYSMLCEVWKEKSYSNHFPFNHKSVIVDIGAHNGYFSVFASKFSHPDSIIFSYEPVKENFDILYQNIKANNITNIHSEMKAVSTNKGFVTLYINQAHTGGHSLLKDRVEVYGKENVSMQKIPCISFQNIISNDINKIDFCKIDCEGAEYDILLNTHKEIICKVDVYAIEFHEFGGHEVNELVSFFEKNNYTVTYSFSPSKRGIRYGMLWAF